MNKQELLAHLKIAKAKLDDSMYNWLGCFDETAQHIFMLALESGLLQEESSEDVEIQLDKSVPIIHYNKQEYIDGIFLDVLTGTKAYFTASSSDGSKIYYYNIEEMEREDVIKVVEELIKMCKRRFNMIGKEKLHQILSSLWKNDESFGKTYYNQALQDIQTAIDLYKESVSEDLEEEISRCIIDEDMNFDSCARHFANWQKEQMMANAIDGIVRPDDDEVWCDLKSFNFEDGDKVKVIIIKES